MLRKTLLTTAVLGLALAGPAAAAPSYDDFATPLDLGTATDPPGTLFDTLGTDTEVGEPKLPDGALHTVWLKWTPAASGAVKISACEFGVPKVVRAYAALTAPAKVSALAPAREGQAGLPELAERCDDGFRAVKGTPYFIQVDVVGASSGQGQIWVDQDIVAPATPKFEASWPAESVGSQVPGAFGSESTDIARYECTLGEADEAFACAPGKPLTGLTPGVRTLKVRAVDTHGNLGPWGSKTWTVLPAPVVAPVVAPVATPPAAPPVADTPAPQSVTPPPPVPSCAMTARAPKTVRRSVLRARGLKVTAAPGCRIAVAFRQHGKRLKSARKASRGTLVVVVGAGRAQRTLKVRVS